MNRRRLLVALALLVPLALFGAAKWVTRFRPVVIGKISGSKNISYIDDAVRVGRHALVAGGGRANWNRFDLNFARNTRRILTNETLVEDTDLAMQVRVNAAGTTQLLLHDGKLPAPAAYDLREQSGLNARPNYPGPNPDNYEAHGFSRRNLRVSPTSNRVECVWRQTYYRWNLATHALERRVEIGPKNQLRGEERGGEKTWALTRDGETLVLPLFSGVSRFSTRTGKRIARLPLSAPSGEGDGSGWISPSHFGGYALYTHHKTKSVISTARLYELRTGRLLWKFDVPDTNYASPSTFVAAFAPDEKTVAIARTELKLWEIRDTQTGRIVRTLPLMPKTISAAFSPDGNTLYCVAATVLYRQRAR